MDELPRLRPTQWDLLDRFIAIEQRMADQHAEGPRAISIMFSANGPHIVRPGVAAAHIDRGDLSALRDAGAFDIHGWNSSMATVRISQRGLDLAAARHQAANQPTAEQLLDLYRQRRRWLAGRIAELARWGTLAVGVAIVVWSALSGSWPWAVVGAIGAIAGTPVTRIASWVHRHLTEQIDRWLLKVFEPGGPGGGRVSG